MSSQKRSASAMSPDSTEMQPRKELKLHYEKPKNCSICCPGCCENECWDESDNEYKHNYCSLCDERRLKEVQEYFENNVPHAWVPQFFKDYLIREADIRLRRAEIAGITLEEIYYGDDCLPTWDGADQEHVGALHMLIQDRCFSFTLGNNLGDLFKDDMINKGNAKLAQALEQGATLHNVLIGPRMLPYWWKDPVPENKQDDNVSACTAPKENYTPKEDSTSSPSDPSSTNTHTPDTSVLDTDIEPSDGFASNFNDVEEEHVSVGSCSYCSRVQLSPTGEVTSPYSDDDIYTIWLKKHYAEHTVAEHARIASALASEEPNVLHEVQIVSDSREHSVDLEVYITDDDSEIEDLPEVELAVDRESYEYFYDTHEATDIEFEGGLVTCLDHLDYDPATIDREEAKAMAAQGNWCESCPIPTIEGHGDLHSCDWNPKSQPGDDASSPILIEDD